MSAIRSAVLAGVALLILQASAGAAAYDLRPTDNWYGVLNGDGLQPGDEVVLQAGAYIVHGETMFWMGHMGTAENPITIRAAEGAEVVFTRANQGQITDYYNLTNNVVNVLGAQHLTISGIEVTGGNWGIRIGSRRSDLVDPTSAKLWDAAYVTVADCHVHHTQNTAISANFPGDYNQGMVFRGNEVNNSGGHGEGFYLGGNNGNSIFYDGLIENNYIHDLLNDHNGVVGYQGDGVEIKDGSYNNVVRNNVIHDTNYPGVLVYGTYGRAPNVIEGNVIWDTRENGIQACSEAVIRNNIIYSCAVYGIESHDHQNSEVGALEIVNNTIIMDNGKFAVHLNQANDGAPCGPSLVANNATYSSTSDLAIYASLVTLAGNVASSNPGADFQNVAGLNFYPTSGSAALGAADASHVAEMDFNGMLRGAGLDAGAYAWSAGGNPGWTIAGDFKFTLRFGDANCDGVVNVGDLAILAGNWQDSGVYWWNADFNNDAAVDVGDLALLAGNWNGAPGGVGGLAGTPEPAAVTMLLIGAVALLRRNPRS